jgi:hypothetical protein
MAIISRTITLREYEESKKIETLLVCSKRDDGSTKQDGRCK